MDYERRKQYEVRDDVEKYIEEQEIKEENKYNKESKLL